MSQNLTSEQRTQIDSLIFAGQKIQAIKALRDAANADLLAAKQVVEAREAQLRQSDPEKFTAKKSGCAAVLLFFIAMALLVCRMA